MDSRSGQLCFLAALLAHFCTGSSSAAPTAPSFVISGTSFVRDGKPFRVISGSMHYFRIHPSQWQDGLQKMKACGLNAVQTVIPWNVHEPQPGQFDFVGIHDIVSFVKTAQQEGLLVILRPGPYICAEWDAGGIPYWLFRQCPEAYLRSSDPCFLKAVDAWWNTLLPRLAPLVYSRGGPVIMTQIENEYGSYGWDKPYLLHLVQLLRQNGMSEQDVIIHSTDGPSDRMLEAVSLPTVFLTIDFAPDTDPAEVFPIQRRYQPTGPYMNSELYTGWITHWGDAHMSRADAAVVCDGLNKTLSYFNASLNMYMFHGGTNWAFFSGSNTGDQRTDYFPDVTSYDYDAPISEAGDVTPKYTAICEVIAYHLAKDEPEDFSKHHSKRLPAYMTVKNRPKAAYGPVTLTERAGLFDNLAQLSVPVTAAAPYTMESLGQDYGFILYRANITGPSGTLTIQDVRDRACVYVNSTYQGTANRTSGQQSVSVNVPAGSLSTLDILVENLGRVNYGNFMRDYKGISEGVLFGQFIFNWQIFSLPLTNLQSLDFSQATLMDGPAFYRGEFTIQDSNPLDTWISLAGWSKGNVFINGYNVGRYWDIGPQLSHYIPAAYLTSGKNEIIVFEIHSTSSLSVSLDDAPHNR